MGISQVFSQILPPFFSVFSTSGILIKQFLEFVNVSSMPLNGTLSPLLTISDVSGKSQSQLRLQFGPFCYSTYLLSLLFQQFYVLFPRQ